MGRLLLWSAVVAFLLSTPIVALGWPRFAQLATDLHDFLLYHPYFSVREIKVSGGQKVGGSEVVAMAGLSHGMNIWKIDPRAIEEKVSKHPWVKRVLVRREFPHRVVIEVEERMAKGIVVLGKLYYVDVEGLVFKEVGEGENVDFPFLTGLRRVDLLSPADSSRRRIQEALRLGDFLGRSSLSLSEIHFSRGGGVVLYPMAYPIALTMGWGDWQDKIERLERVLSEWGGKEDRLAGLDLSFRDHVVARTKRRMKG